MARIVLNGQEEYGKNSAKGSGGEWQEYSKGTGELFRSAKVVRGVWQNSAKESGGVRQE